MSERESEGDALELDEWLRNELAEAFQARMWSERLGVPHVDR